MARKKLRFTVGITVVIAAIVYFAISGFQEGKAYYKTIEELAAMGPGDDGKRLRVAGVVKDGTIERDGIELTFQLAQEELALSVHYSGTDPVRPLPEFFCVGVYIEKSARCSRIPGTMRGVGV